MQKEHAEHATLLLEIKIKFVVCESAVFEVAEKK